MKMSFKLKLFLSLIGPGLVVMLADTDAGSIITAAQTGAIWKYRMLSLQIILIPLLYIAQELTVRLGIVTNMGHGELIKQKFGSFWAWVSIATLIITGDNKVVAKAVSEKLGLDGYYAEVLPEQKLAIIKSLQEQGEFVAMTGDGVNDAPALAQADVGIAVGSGTDVAAETADIILVESNPQDIASLIMFGKATYRKMTQNLVWATAYNVVAVPLAAGVLYSYGIVLSPAVGAVFMSLSTVIVAFNAQLLRKTKGLTNIDKTIR